MATHSLSLSSSIFAKTDLGREEIQHRSLRLAPLLRRLLLLVDGERDVAQLTPFVAGQDVAAMLHELTELGCVQAVAAPASPPVTAPAAAAAADLRDRPGAARTDPTPAGANPSPALPADLPDPASRAPAQVEMARNFMINTINALLEPNTRLTLVKKIFDSADAAALREHYPQWDAAISSSWSGARRITELRKQLFAVL
jgi:hypothetical protein